MTNGHISVSLEFQRNPLEFQRNREFLWNFFWKIFSFQTPRGAGSNAHRTRRPGCSTGAQFRFGESNSCAKYSRNEFLWKFLWNRIPLEIPLEFLEIPEQKFWWSWPMIFTSSKVHPECCGTTQVRFPGSPGAWSAALGIIRTF